MQLAQLPLHILQSSGSPAFFCILCAAWAPFVAVQISCVIYSLHSAHPSQSSADLPPQSQIQNVPNGKMLGSCTTSSGLSGNGMLTGPDYLDHNVCHFQKLDAIKGSLGIKKNNSGLGIILAIIRAHDELIYPFFNTISPQKIY